MRIKNTLYLDEMWCSEDLIEEIKANPDLELEGTPEEMKFDHQGNLLRGW